MAIVPITLVLAVYTSKKEAKNENGSYSVSKIFPWFVLAFAAASVINTFISLPVVITKFLLQSGKFVIVMAMVSVGLNTNWVILAPTSLRVQHFIMGIF